MTASPNLTILKSNFLIDASGSHWTLTPSLSSGAQICRDGVIMSATANVVFLLYKDSIVYHANATNNFYLYQNSGWIACSDPRLTHSESVDGTLVTTAGPSLYSTTEAWSLIKSATASLGMQVAVNGVVDSTTNSVTLLLYKNHKVYQENSGGGWWYKVKSSDAWTTSSDPRAVVLPTVPTVVVQGNAPPAAAAAGFNRLVFNEDFTTDTACAPNGGATSGYSFYWGTVTANNGSQYAVNKTQSAAQVTGGNAGPNASANGGILSLFYGVGSNSGGFASVPSSVNTVPAPGAWQHCYMEAYVQTNHQGNSGSGWPAFWSWSLENQVASATGQPSPETAECDIFEFMPGYSPPYRIGTTLHNWYAGGGQATSNTGNPIFDFDSNWHTYGALWVSTGNGTGNVKFFIDNVQCTYPNGVTTGVATGNGSKDGQTILESRHLYLALSAGIGWPVNFDWVRVWQA